MTIAESSRMSWKQKRELGIAPLQILRGVKEMAKNGEIDKSMSAKEIAFAYIASVSDSPEYGAAWDEVHDGTYGVDWDNLFAFIEKLIELFLRIWPLIV